MGEWTATEPRRTRSWTTSLDARLTCRDDGVARFLRGYLRAACLHCFLSVAIASAFVTTHKALGAAHSQTEPSVTAEPSEGRKELLQRQIERLFELRIANASATELEQVAAEINDTLGPIHEGLSTYDYFRELLKVSSRYPEGRFWTIATKGSYGTPVVHEDFMAFAAISLYDPYENREVSEVSRQVFRYVESGIEAGIGWSEGRPRDWRLFEEYLEGHWGQDEYQEQVRNLFVFMSRAEPQRAFDVILLNGRLAPETLTERQQIARLARVIDECLWRQEHQFIESDTVTPDAREAMERLVAHKRWWVRMFALHMMLHEPEFFSMPLFERLADDEEEVIRNEAAMAKAEIQENPPPGLHENLRPLLDDKEDRRVPDAGD